MDYAFVSLHNNDAYNKKKHSLKYFQTFATKMNMGHLGYTS